MKSANFNATYGSNDKNNNTRKSSDLISALLSPCQDKVTKVKIALESGTNPNILFENFKGGPKISPLHYAAETENLELAKVLLKFKANPNVLDGSPNGESPLHICAWKNSYSMCRLLTSKGADPNILCKKGYAPIHVIIIESMSLLKCEDELKRKKMLVTLLKCGASPNTKTNNRVYDDVSPLIMAASCQHTQADCAILLKYGANPLIKDRVGRTALDVAKEENKEIIKNGLRKYKIKKFSAELNKRNENTLRIGIL